MKNSILSKTGIICLILFSVLFTACNEDDENIGDQYFDIVSSDLTCCNSIKEVPINGADYKLDVKTTKDVKWSVKVESGNWITVSPKLETKGSAEIIIVAAENIANQKDRSAVVVIKNSLNSEILRYQFTQSYDPNKIVRIEDDYTFIDYKEDDTHIINISNIEGQNFTVNVMDEESVSEFNKENNTSYQLLPAGNYILPTDLTLDNNNTSTPLEVNIKKEIGKLDVKKGYLLPISISSDGKKRMEIFVKIKIEIPYIAKYTKDFTFYNAGDDTSFDVNISRKSGDITFVEFSEEEKSEYNSNNNTDFIFLSSDMYELPSAFSFDDTESSRDVTLNLKKEVGSLDDDKAYALLFKVLVNGKPNSEYCLKYNIITPKITMSCDDYKRISINNRIENDKAELDFSLSIDVENIWNFNVAFEDDINILQTIVDKYNLDNNKNFTLLPWSNCELSETKFEEGNKSINIKAIFNKDGIDTNKDYLLPITPNKCIDRPFVIEEKISFIHVVIEDKIESIAELDEIALTNNMLSSNSEEGSWKVTNIIQKDGFWESIWGPGGNPNGPKLHKDFGAYIDIDLSTNSINKGFAINFSPRSLVNAVPNEIMILAGTSENDLVEIGKLEFEKNNLPYTKDSWIGNGEENIDILPIFHLGNKETKLIRIAFLSSRNKSGSNNYTKNLTNFVLENHLGGDYPCVAVQQLKIYGK